jgi:anti-sigma B factor antagonist
VLSVKLEISSEKIDVGFLLKFKGDVDMNTSADVRNALTEVFREGASGMKALLIDLSQVRYMDSSGIATLVEIMQNCRKKGARLSLCELSPPVKAVFELARLTSVFEIYPTVEDAVKSL